MITFDTLLNETENRIPLFRREYENKVNMGEIAFEDGLHIIFSLVYAPMLLRAIKEDDKMAKEMFSYLEEMAESEDKRVQEICDQSVLESLCDEVQIRTIWPLVGEKTREGIRYITEYQDLKW